MKNKKEKILLINRTYMKKTENKITRRKTEKRYPKINYVQPKKLLLLSQRSASKNKKLHQIIKSPCYIKPINFKKILILSTASPLRTSLAIARYIDSLYQTLNPIFILIKIYRSKLVKRNCTNIKKSLAVWSSILSKQFKAQTQHRKLYAHKLYPFLTKDALLSRQSRLDITQIYLRASMYRSAVTVRNRHSQLSIHSQINIKLNLDSHKARLILAVINQLVNMSSFKKEAAHPWLTTPPPSKAPPPFRSAVASPPTCLTRPTSYKRPPSPLIPLLRRHS